jgi:peptidyl-prolyl cis-trans isomerase B (cyclophilin B)
MRCLTSGTLLLLTLLSIQLQQAQAQPASASQPAATEPKTMSNSETKSSATQPTRGNPRVVLQTSMGQMVIELYADKAPVSVENFLKYVDEGFFTGTIFHRVIPNFMIQGGGFAADMQQKKTHAPIKNEAANGLKNDRGTLAMARTNDPNSATAQFFINVKDNAFLNYSGPGPRGAGYAVFGKVVEGMDVADKIVDVATTTVGPFENVPKTAVVIESAKRQ